MPLRFHKIETFKNISTEQFKQDIYLKRTPCLLRSLNIGEATNQWTVEYLKEAAGDKHVQVHVSATPHLDFINKNFVYKNLSFPEFLDKCSYGTKNGETDTGQEYYYLRAVGENFRKDVADFKTQFPCLAKDLIIPDLFPEDRYFSSVLRLGSAGLQLWTHYDVMDNILIQVRGRKRCVLFPPTDAQYLYLSGDKSEVLDIDNPDLTRFPDFGNVTWYEGEMEPGDILFIPALWFHNMRSLDFGIAVNVFWYHLEPSLYDRKDLYGNKDLIAASNATQLVDKAVKMLDTLPSDYRDFYMYRLTTRLKNKCCRE